nr:unnamed protein product [Spirometra erinaceieuropaei]
MITEDQIGHENLIAIACTYVEALASQPHKTFDDTSIDVQQFLTVLENIFYDGLRGSSKWRNNDGVWKFMSTVCRPIPHSCIALVDALDNLKSSISKFAFSCALFFASACSPSACISILTQLSIQGT